MRAKPRIALATVLAVLGWAIARSVLTKGYYFDEMWRVDFITARSVLDRYWTHDTPIPIGWVYLHRPIFAVLPASPALHRVIALSWLVPGGLLQFDILKRLAGEKWAALRPVAWAAAMLSPLLCTTAHLAYFNNYFFEIFYCALLADLYLRAREARPSPWLLVAIVLAPVLVMSPLFSLPAILLDLGWRAARKGDRRSFVLIAGAGLISAALAIAVFKLLYLHPRGLCTGFWADVTLAGKPLREQLAIVWAAARNTFWAPYEHALLGSLRSAGAVALLAFAMCVLGICKLWPHARSLLIVFVSSLLVSAGASLVASWPFGPVRVNASFFWIPSLFSLVGCLALAKDAAGLLRAPEPLAIAAAGALLFPFSHLRPPVKGKEPFARGLERDLEFVAENGGRRNLVVAYHFMSHFYEDYYLVTLNRSDRTFEIVRELRGDRTLYDRFGEIVANHADVDTVWCVIPHAPGLSGERSRACLMNSPEYVETYVFRGEQALVRGFTKRKP